MKISVSKQGIKAIKGMDKPTKQRIKNAIQGIPDGNIKPLVNTDGDFRLRVGDWRIIFCYIAENEILIERIVPRGEAYKSKNL